MGYTAGEAHVHADELGDTFTDDMVERIEVRLGNPDRCPHGWPIDPAFEQLENKELAPLADLDIGREAEIVRLAEHDGELLHWFYDEGFTPGAHVVIREAQPAAGQFKVLLSGNERAIGEKAAAGPLRPPELGQAAPPGFRAFRCAIASIVTIGLTPEAVGNAEPSAITRLRTSHVSPVGDAADLSGEPPMRAEPIRWNEYSEPRPGPKRNAPAGKPSRPALHPSVGGEDLACAGGGHDAAGSVDPGRQSARVVVGQPVRRDRLAVAPDPNPPGAARRAESRRSARAAAGSPSAGRAPRLPPTAAPPPAAPDAAAPSRA